MNILPNGGEHRIYAIFYGFAALMLFMSLMFISAPFGYHEPISHNQALAHGQACQNQVMYAVHDKGLDDSIFFRTDLNSGLSSQIGEEKEGYDVEAIDTHPQTGVIYGLTGDTDDPASAKKLLIIDKTSGIPDLGTGVGLDISSGQEYKGASFHPTTSELWATGENLDLRVINLADGTSEVRKTLSGDPEALAWDMDGEYLYILYQNGSLDRYNNNTQEITTMCTGMGDIEGMEFDLNGNLIIGYHSTTNGFNIDVFDPNTCQVFQPDTYNTNLYDIETMSFDCVEEPYCELELVKEDFVDSVAPGDALEYRLTLTNTGTADCTGGGVKVRDYFDAMTDYINSDVTPSTVTSSYVEWNFGTLASGETKVVNVTTDVSDEAECNSTLLNKSKYWSNETGWGSYVEEDTLVSCETIPLVKKSIKTCTGSGELFVYQDDQTQPIDTSFETERDQILVFARENTNLSAKVNGISQPLDLVSSKSFARIYSLDTSPSGTTKTIEITGPSGKSARYVQAYLAQDESSPVYDLATLEVIIDEEVENDMYLTPGTYSYVFFDKYTYYNNGSDDSRNLTVVIEGPSSTVVNQSYTKPYPSPVEGVVLDDYTVHEEGTHTLKVDTDDSIYWLYTSCSPPPEEKECKLELTKFDDPDPVDAGGTLTYQLTLKNVGDADCTGGGVKLEETYDSQTTFVSSDPAPSQGTTVWNFGTMKPNEEENVSITVNVSSAAECGTLLNKARYWSKETGWGPYTEEQTTVNCPPDTGSIAGCKYDDADNNGLIDQGEQTIPEWPIILIKPDQTTVEISTDDNGCFVFSDLPPGEYRVGEGSVSGWVQTYPTSTAYTVNLASSQDITQIDFANWQVPVEQTYCGDGIKQSPNDVGTGGPNNDGYEECDGQDGVGENQACTEQCVLEDVPPGCTTCGSAGRPWILIKKSVDPGITNPNTKVSYTLKITNQGNADGYDLFVTDTLPPNFTYTDIATSTATSTGIATSTRSWKLGTIKRNKTKTITYSVYVDKEAPAGMYPNTATANVSNGVDPYNHDEDTAEVEVRIPTVFGEEFAPILTIDKEINFSFVNPGQVVTYTVTIRNRGNLAAANVTLVDRLPDGLTFVDNNSQVNSWNIGDLAPSQSVSLSYDVLVGKDAEEGIYENLAVAHADNHPDVSDKEQLEVREIKILGLPDTDGTFRLFLSIAVGVLLMILSALVWKLQQVQRLDLR